MSEAGARMTLADTLSFMNRDNYKLLSIVIGLVVGLIPSIGYLGSLVAGFLYAYFSIYFGEIPKQEFEAAKSGAFAGAIVGVVGSIISALLISPFLALSGVLPFLPGLVFILALITGLILGAIVGGIGGLLSALIE